jgi:hypothetical protein
MVERHDRSSASIAAASGPAARERRPGRTPALAASGTRTRVDVLSDVLQTVRLTGAVFFPVQAAPPWADEIPAATALAPLVPGAQHVISYHIVLRGDCWAALPDGLTAHL